MKTKKTFQVLTAFPILVALSSCQINAEDSKTAPAPQPIKFTSVFSGAWEGQSQAITFLGGRERGTLRLKIDHGVDTLSIDAIELEQAGGGRVEQESALTLKKFTNPNPRNDLEYDEYSLDTVSGNVTESLVCARVKKDQSSLEIRNCPIKSEGLGALFLSMKITVRSSQLTVALNLKNSLDEFASNLVSSTETQMQAQGTQAEIPSYPRGDSITHP